MTPYYYWSSGGQRRTCFGPREQHPSSIVIPSEARDLHLATNCRSLASLGMTIFIGGPSVVAVRPALFRWNIRSARGRASSLLSRWSCHCVRLLGGRADSRGESGKSGGPP